MNGSRILSVAAVDLRLAWRRPLWITLTVLLAIFALFGAAEQVRVQAGDVMAGGKQAWLNSQFNVAFWDAAVLGLLLPIFAAIAAGLPLLQDVDRKVDRVLLGTRLTPIEYTAGRFLGAILPMVAIMGIWVLLQMAFFELWPVDNPEKVRGPFAAWNYIWPAILFSLPLLLPIAGGSMVIGAWTRSPILVFLLPLMVLIGGALFLWSWSPEWLPMWANRLIMMLDPAANRWLDETWLKADRGVDFYNTNPVSMDAAFAASRVAWCLVGVLAVPLTARTLFRRSLSKGERRLGAEVSIATLAALPSAPPAPPVAAGPRMRLDQMAMRTEAPGFVDGLRAVLRNELRILLRSPGVLFFGLLIILQVLGSSFSGSGWLGADRLATTGSLATGSFNTLTLMLLFLTLFYTVESLVREERLGFAGLLRTSAVGTPSLMLGKILANAGLALVLMAATVLGCTIVLLVQLHFTGIWPPFEIMRFLQLWVLVLTPTLVLWCSFVALVHGLVRNRYATWAVGLGTLIATGFAQQFGYLTWVGNWHMWSTLLWSDLDRLEFLRPSIVANRLFVLSLAALLFLGAMAVHPRRSMDWQRVIDRIRPRPILMTALRLSPLLALVIGLGIYNWVQARNGFQGAVVERKSRDYWKRNNASFPPDAPLPALSKVTGSVDIDPFDRSLRVQGTYVIRNPHDAPMEQIPLTQGEHYRNLKWTLNGKLMEPRKKDSLEPPPMVEDRAGLWVFTPVKPLAKDETIAIGFSFDGVFPAGWTRNGGGASEFILPSGVVLTSFSSSFMPPIGYQEGVGVDERNATDPKEPLPDDWKKRTDPAFGSAWGFDVTLQVTGPEDWTLNCVGVPGEPVVKDGRKTVTWTTDHSVRSFNIVGGPLVRNEGAVSSIFHSPRHPWNVKVMQEALDASRECYGKWFGAYPWRDLKLTEFPGLAGYAQGFPGNITFSESIGFLTRPGAADEVDVVFYVTAHEAGHQWWGNMLMPGKGLGGNILSEGLANYSALLLTLEKRGDEQRQRMLRQWEDDYCNMRSADSERPMVRISGTMPGDSTVTYDKGGWVFWMLTQVMGRERMLAGLQDFIRTYTNGPDYPLLQDFLVVMRRHATDLPAFDAFARQWFESVVLPEFKLWDVKVTRPDAETWVVEGTLENVGSGTFTVEVGAEGQAPEPAKDAAADAKPPKAPRARTQVAIGPEARVPFRVACPFEPVKAIVDPDVQLLQLRRKLAEAKVSSP